MLQFSNNSHNSYSNNFQYEYFQVTNMIATVLQWDPPNAHILVTTLLHVPKVFP